ncbi:MAG TPA: hypothetical protein VGC77_06990 [Rhodopseudomonas sp.]|uniref:YncE family protein n=1 Tax=Rhodopseudomonas sp. TaxID=1078 RepID=UPI002ED92208
MSDGLNRLPFAHRLVAAALLWLIGTAALAADSLTDYRRTLFVSGRDSTALIAIDIDADAVSGRLELGLLPREIQVSQTGGWMAVIDRQQPRVVVVDLSQRGVRSLPLPLIPTRLRISPDGGIVAAIDDRSGAIVLIDPAQARETARLEGPAAIRDAMFSTDGKALLVAADSIDGIAVYDVATAALATIIAGDPVRALIGAPNGREAYALTAPPQRTILHIDLRSRTLLGRLRAANAGALYPSRSGNHLMLLDPDAGLLSLVPAQPLAQGVALPGAVGASEVYGAWFDTVAFVASRAQPKLLVYDLERRQPGAAILLSGAPGAGVVAPDGEKLYLPIAERHEVAVIDANLRRSIGAVAVEFAPLQAVIAGGYGLCH